MTRKTGDAGLALIKSFEGCRLDAYKPVATETYYTIGYGHYGPDVKEGMTITQAQADSMLVSDLAKYEAYVNDASYVPATSQLTQHQFDALVSFCYNCGAGNLRSLCADRTPAQIAEHITSYNKSSGTVLAGLVKRRAAELALFNKEDDEAMTAAEQAAFKALEAKVAALESKQSMDMPAWAKEAVEAAVKAGLIDSPNGRSFDFYSTVTVLHRKGLI